MIIVKHIALISARLVIVALGKQAKDNHAASRRGVPKCLACVNELKFAHDAHEGSHVENVDRVSCSMRGRER